MYDEETFPTSAELSEQLTGYQVLRKISATQMSSVYLAQETGLGRRVVVKVLHREHTDNPRLRERFRREVLAAARMDHPNIVPLYSSGEIDGRRYLILRYVDGGDLGALLRSGVGRLDLAETARILTQVAAALDAAHAAGIVHRDVKPSNILVDAKTRHIYLSDFGIAKVEESTTVTRTGQFVGTAAYSAPEQIGGHHIDARADVYALGCVVQHCLTGRPPFGGEMAGVIGGHLHRPPPPVTASRPDLDPAVDAVVARALAKQPDQRYSTCGEFAAALAALGQGQRSDGGTLTTRRDFASTPIAEQPTIPPNLFGQLSTTVHRHRLPVTVGMAAVLFLTTAVFGTVWLARGSGDGADLPDAIPVALRSACVKAEGAVDSYRCRAESGHNVLFSHFDGQAELAGAYDKVVRESGVSRGQGDCSAGTGAEHRYPAAGASNGRLLCFTKGSTTSFVWTDDKARLIARADGTDDLALVRAWNSWTKAPAFPSKEERALMVEADRQVTDCKRVPPGALEEFREVIAAVDCSVEQFGSDRATYYRFASVDGLRRSFQGQVSKAKAPYEDDCPDAKIRGYLGVDNWEFRDYPVGSVLCHPGTPGQYVVQWTAEPLMFMGRAVGTNTADLSEWWDYSAPPDATKMPKGINAQARPAFPTTAERAVLDRVPPGARTNCMRPAAEQAREELDGAQATGVICDPRGEDSSYYFVYYKFADATAMRKNYQRYAGAPAKKGTACTAAKFKAEGPYSIGGRPVGRLWCGTDEDDERFLTWTHDALNIQVMAVGIDDPPDLLGWLKNAGPQ